jgi:8-oxo-dGTP diphosphatase
LIYNNPPEGFKAKLEVVACFIEYQDEVLFLHRVDNIPQGGTWAIPGGKINTGEALNLAIKREVLEETGVELKEPEFLKTVYIRYPEYDYVYHMFREVLDVKPQIKLEPKESQSSAWLTRKQANALEEQTKLILDEMPCIEEVYQDGNFGLIAANYAK